jgi:hypothetical protein
MDNDSAVKNNRPIYVLSALTAIALLACLGLVGYLLLPGLATRYLPAEQIRQMGFADFHGRITRIGPTRAAAGPFLFGHADRPAVSIQSVEIDYTPDRLIRQHIRCLRLADLTINALLQPDGLVFPGLEWDRSNRTEPAGNMTAGMRGSIGKIEIRSARVLLKWRKEVYRIPFDADIHPRDGNLTKLTVRANLYPGDQRLSMTARLDLEAGRGDATMNGAAIHLDRFADLFHRIPKLDLTGSLDLGISAGFRMNPFGVSDVRSTGTWRHGRLELGALSVVTAATDTAALFSAISADGIKWQIEASGVGVEEPLPVALNSIQAALDVGGDGPAIDGGVELAMLPFSRRCPLPVALETDLPLSLTAGIRGKPSGRWVATCQTTAGSASVSAPVELITAGGRLTCGAPRVRLELSGENRRIHGRWQLDLGPVEVSLDAGVQASLPSLQGKGTLQSTEQDGEAVRSGEARLSFPRATVSGGGLAGGAGAVSVLARFHQNADRSAGVSGRLQVKDGRLHHAASRLDLSGIRLELPYASFSKPDQDPGRFSIGRIRQGNLTLGRLVGRATCLQDTLALAAEYDSALFPKMTATIQGRLNLSGGTFQDASLQIDLPDYDLPEGFDLGRLRPDLDGVGLSGAVSARAQASVSRNGLDGRLDFDFNGGRLDIADKQLTLEGIDTALHFPELPRIRSAPSQALAFRRATLGRIVVDDGRVDFQVESPNTLFVEKGGLNWCGGRVDAQSLRLVSGKQAYALSLYCQRLSLSRILDQLGSINARGSGTVNGRIPVAYDNGRIRFDDGFLFSTPGEGGKIRLTGTDMLTRGIPAGTPQFAQVDLAREALKDYDYQWAKLGMNTEGENLVMRLQFDGKPAGALPFVFQREIGSFARVKAGEQGSIFQGIALDVNLRLPLDRLLEYKDVVDMIEQ